LERNQAWWHQTCHFTGQINGSTISKIVHLPRVEIQFKGGCLNRPTAKFLNANVLTQWLAPVRVEDIDPRCASSSSPGERRIEDVCGLQGWKRGLDILMSLIGLGLCWPLMGMAAVLIKVTSPGPILFKQERIGLNRRTGNRRNGHNLRPMFDRRNGDRRRDVKHGKPFLLYKFRSMKIDAENGTPEWATAGDPRVTWIGKILRKTRIDETPQFFNVLRGEMSVVGPRPERDYFYEKLSQDVPEFPLRLRTKPGITGLAQVSHGYTNTVNGARTKLEHDLTYIDRLAPATDVKILMKTVSVVLTGKGAC
jgi:lipopolysaccharide/colanic/teichoic acid biosynthesis glycosyltransferase